MYLLCFFALVGLLVLLGREFPGKESPPTSVDPAVIEAFAKFWRQEMMWAVLLVPYMIWVLYSPSSGGALHGPLMLVAWIIFVWLCVHHYRTWCCPKCGDYLGMGQFHPSKCPSCGAALRQPGES
ncbi:MAG: hypothetical protein ABI379_00380 [Rhodanobacter sp.]